MIPHLDAGRHEPTTAILEIRLPTHGQRPYHHGDLRRSLIQAGSKIIEEKGLAGLSLREVAQSSWAAFQLVETIINNGKRAPFPQNDPEPIENVASDGEITRASQFNLYSVRPEMRDFGRVQGVRKILPEAYS